MSSLALNGGVPVRSHPFADWPVHSGAEEDALMEVVRSGRWGRLDGAKTRAFEERFADFVGARYAVAVNSGQTALRLALLALDCQAGDEVIVPPYTFVATAAAVIEANLTPVFADIDPDSLCLSPRAVEAAVTRRTRAILPVHLGGQMADMDALMEIAGKRRLAVIEDASHAHGSEYQGVGAGALGDLGCFSFQASKNLNCGEGGVVVTDDDGLAAAVDALQNNGRVPGDSRYAHATLGGNYRMTEFQSAILLAQMARLEAQTRRRDANGLTLNARIGPIPGFRPQPRGLGETRNAYHLWCFGIDPDAFGAPRDRVLAALRAEGIPCGPGYATLVYEHELFTHKRFGPYRGPAERYDPDVARLDALCPVAQRVSKVTGAWLPQTVLLAEPDDIDDIVAAFTKVWDHRKELNR